MSETTQILFNSPALHSLKRDQLVKLCKIHSIKASGKNVELIQKLKDHASTLPPGDPLRIAIHTDDDNEDEELSTLESKRPSSQWEVVMEDILEVPEPSRTTLNSLRSVTSNGAPDEFGAGGGSKSSSVSSSLKAIANSFNFIRATSVKSSDSQTSYPNISDELANHSVPYSSIPEPLLSDMPQTDHFKFSTPDSTMQEHIQSPSGNAVTNANPAASPTKTTIRLVSASAATPSIPQEPGTPQLRPVDPEFDLVMDSPGAKGQIHVPVWPLSPHLAPSERLYPALPVDELDDVKQNKGDTKLVPSRSTSRPKVYPRPSNNVQDMFSPAPKPPIAPKESSGIPRSEPFLFGSPLPRHSVSNKDFDAAAASVLEEMNKRLSAAGVQKVDADVFGGSAIAKTTNATSLESSKLRALGKADRFGKSHEEQFNKMDSIATHYAAKRGSLESKKRKSDVLGHGSAPGKKRSSVNTRVISTGSRTRMGIPGGFGDDEEEEAPPDEVQEEGDRRMSKRVRVLEGDGGKDKGRRLTISPRKTDAEAKQEERERAATRKMLDARKEKRRSSRHGRVSTAGPQASNNKGKAKPRFGFFSSAKSIVRSVWNFGAGSPTKASRTTTTTAATKSQTAGTATEPQEAKPGPPKKPSLPASRPSGAPVNRKSMAPTRTVSGSSKVPTTESSRSRPPSSTFGSQSNKNGRSADLSSNAAVRPVNPTPASSTSSRRSVLAGSANNASSLGTKGSVGLPRSSATHSLSAGSQRRGPTSNAPKVPNGAQDERAAEGSNKAPGSIFSPSRATATSRLFAPTASSLAKTRSPTVAKSRTSSIVAQRAKTPPHNSALDAITNSPRGGSAHASKIFSTPLMAVPPPVRPTSLAAAAAALAASASPERKQVTGGQKQQQQQQQQQSQARKPRISRSRIIAKLGAQRAAAAASSSTIPSAKSLSSRSAAGGTSKIPARVSAGGAARTLRVRSSMGTAARRSYAGAKSASRGSDVLMSAKKHVRQSEYIRRRSRLAGSAVGVGAVHAADGPDGTMAMDIDDD
ncbi:hypothetical protein EI94DRAFT_1800569 [Lactarius quietus]|nr:hypothetical protein EI94DRAFT_1800569 [Lactarius quietus]